MTVPFEIKKYFSTNEFNNKQYLVVAFKLL
ncbi:hypothetical protein QF004_002259 [Chryseobacterium sp. MDT2-18]|nr:hypothetical protein [Chryseobacterium sp. MDT2-18]